jgi:2-iminobutanoate/2-iminopropanoate deaminase
MSGESTMTRGPIRRPLRHAKLAVTTLALLGAVMGSSAAATPPRVEFLNSGKVLPGSLPFSEAVRVGDTLYLSGAIGVEPGTLKLVPGGIEPESRRTLQNLRITLEAHGYSLSDVVKCTIMLADIGEWARFNAIYGEFFAAPYPARSAFGTSGLALGARVEVECIAVK